MLNYRLKAVFYKHTTKRNLIFAYNREILSDWLYNT